MRLRFRFLFWKWMHLFHWPGLIFAVPALLIFLLIRDAYGISAWTGIALSVAGWLGINLVGILSRNWDKAYFNFVNRETIDAISECRTAISRIEYLFKPAEKLSEYAEVRFADGIEQKTTSLLAGICGIMREIVERWESEIGEMHPDIARRFKTSYIDPVYSVVEEYLKMPDDSLSSESVNKMNNLLLTVRDALKRQHERLLVEDITDFDSKIQTVKDIIGFDSVLYQVESDRLRSKRERETE